MVFGISEYMSENFKQPSERADRILGDEWTDWDGAGDKPIQGGVGLFLGFSLAVILCISAGLLVLYYLTLPRLVEFHPIIPTIALWTIIILVCVGILAWFQLALTTWTGRNLFIGSMQAFLVYDLVFSRVFRLARLFGISRDRMGHSFIKVSNRVASATNYKKAQKKLLILLPRCLTKELLKEIYALKEQYPLEIFTVSGGELARKKVKEVCPSAIIGVACERDLVSGIRDVGSRIPVIGIPNQRPNGPCKNTLVDIAELKKAVEFYLNG